MPLQISKRALSLAVVLSLSACQERTPEQLAESASMLSSSVVSQGCTFTIAAQARPGTFPPLYDYVVTRQGSGGCPYKANSVTLGSSYSAYAGITGNDLGIAAAYVVKNTPSGSSPLSVYVRQIATDTLGVTLHSTLSCGPSIYSTYLADLFMLNATTVQVNGSKGCVLYGQTEYGTGNSYYAYYFNFFSAPSSPVVIAY